MSFARSESRPRFLTGIFERVCEIDEEKVDFDSQKLSSPESGLVAERRRNQSSAVCVNMVFKWSFQLWHTSTAHLAKDSRSFRLVDILFWWIRIFRQDIRQISLNIISETIVVLWSCKSK